MALEAPRVTRETASKLESVIMSCMKTLMLLLLGLSIAATAQVQTFSTAAGEVKITPVFHAGVLLQAKGHTIYIDPMNAAKYKGLPKADLILITHIHTDHLDPEAIAVISQPATVVIAPASVVESFPAARPMANGETRQWNQWTIEAVPAYNLTRGPAAGELYHPKGRDNGYLLSYGGKRFYFSSDTEGIPEMRALKDIDVAFVCMNLPYTMPPEEAAEAVKAFHPKVVIPYHYRNSDLNVFKQRLAGTGIDVRLLDFYPQ
jgi:L-ascorbate metabolism protein UlaG (beta-lactamase superfamily)